MDGCERSLHQCTGSETFASISLTGSYIIEKKWTQIHFLFNSKWIYTLTVKNRTVTGKARIVLVHFVVSCVGLDGTGRNVWLAKLLLFSLEATSRLIGNTTRGGSGRGVGTSLTW